MIAVPDLKAAADAVVAQLTGAGVNACLDPADWNLPGVRVNPPQVAYRFGKGTWDATWTATAAVPDGPLGSAIANLGELLDKVQDALRTAPVTARPVDVQLTDAGTVPGYELTWTQRIN